MAAFLPGGAFL